MDFSLIETLRWEPVAGFVRLERHLARLAHSADLLGTEGAEKAKAALSGLAHSETPLRIRLELFPNGRIEVQTAVFTPLPPGTTWRLKIAETRLASTDPLLRHKTSRRDVYMQARAEFPGSEADEVILLNEYGDLCEGTITSLFVDDGSGVLKTPPLAAGLLAGVLRAELIEKGMAVEKRLRPEDLSEGRIFAGNSLRGLIPAVFVRAVNAG